MAWYGIHTCHCGDFGVKRDDLNGSKKSNGLESGVLVFAIVVIAYGNVYVIFEFTLIEQFL